VLGPTAGGKSDLAFGLAQRLDGRIISADSMQVYRYMDAGTAKPSPAMRDAVVHHMIDCVDPTQRFTVADWFAAVDPLVVALQSQGVRPIVVGGTNLYINTLLQGMLDGPAIDKAFRASLEGVALSDLHARLREVDPDAADRIHENDRKRITRALEVHHLTGKPISAQQTQWESRRSGPGRTQPRPTVRPGADQRYRHDPILFGLDWPTAEINRRINLRVKAMFFPDKAREQDGIETWEPEDLVTETRRLEASGLLGEQAREALGYKQVLAHLAGEMTLDEAFEKSKILTRRFGKQQRTWLKRFADVRWIGAADRPADQRLEAALRLLE